MKILLSPAKSLNYDLHIETPFATIAHFLKEADFLIQKLQKSSKKELKELMKISENLIHLNYERYQNWELPTELGKHVQPALTVFTGEVYKGLDVSTFSKQDFEYAQERLVILSGLYGVLKPLDLMYPYRLEMGTRWNISSKYKNLYDYWRNHLSEWINHTTEPDEVIVNLASNEYFKAIDRKTLKRKVITPIFKDLKGNQFKTVAIYAKHARGAMAREIIQREYQEVEELKGCDVDGYTYNEKMSSATEWIFVR